MTKFIIDTDPGVDDAIALVLAQQEAYPILGLSLVAGNVHLETAKTNVFRLAKFLRRKFPIYLGSPGPITRPLETAGEIHGQDGLGESNLPYEDYPVSGEAVDFLIRSAQEEEDLCIFALGPLTNLALALRKNPQAFEGSRLIIMGGAYQVKGNTSDLAEFNFYVDPEAADEVLRNFPGDLDLVPLDLTSQCIFSKREIAKIAKANPAMGNFLESITRLYMEAYAREEGIEGCYINDPMTLLVYERPDLFSYERLAFRVSCQEESRGQLLRRKDQGAKTLRIYHKLKEKEVLDYLVEAMSRKLDQGGNR